MNIALTPGERDGHPTVCHFSESSIEAVEASVARLHSWAVVREVQLTGAPFIRLNATGRMVVHLPIVGCADPRPETGVIPGRLQPGRILSLSDVPFARAIEIANRLSDDVDREYGLAGPVEFHAGAAGFASGTLVFPVAAVAPASRKSELATRSR